MGVSFRCVASPAKLGLLGGKVYSEPTPPTDNKATVERNRPMRNECSIERAWRLFLGLMMFSAAAFAVLLTYSAFFAALTRQWQIAGAYVAMAAALAGGVTWLAYNRNELVSLH
jgi:hypothetical protein